MWLNQTVFTETKDKQRLSMFVLPAQENDLIQCVLSECFQNKRRSDSSLPTSAAMYIFNRLVLVNLNYHGIIPSIGFDGL